MTDDYEALASWHMNQATIAAREIVLLRDTIETLTEAVAAYKRGMDAHLREVATYYELMTEDTE